MRTGKSIRGALSYNEQKVNAGKAELLLASKFGCELHQLGFREKLNRFEKLINKSTKVHTNTLHVSLNFSPSDQVDEDKMRAIAMDYMEKIGFGSQPYLAYQHKDTAHPHIHIVTTNIKPNGKPIDMHKIGIRKSEPARKTIELEYNLIQAESVKQENNQQYNHSPVATPFDDPEETKRQISNTVQEIVRSYWFKDLEDFNLLLKRHNAIADPGKPGSRQWNSKGLLYYKIDSNGNKCGVPIKASSIFGSPTLKNLQVKFKAGENRKLLYKERTSKLLNSILAKNGIINEDQFIRIFEKRKIHCVVLRDNTNSISSVVFHDDLRKTAFTNLELGASLAVMSNKIAPSSPLTQSLKEKERTISKNKKFQSAITAAVTNSLLRSLLTAGDYSNSPSPDFKQKKKKKKKPRG